MRSKIENIDDLRSEILRLKLQRFQHEAIIENEVNEIKNKFRLPGILLHKVNTFLGGDDHGVNFIRNRRLLEKYYIL